MDKIEFNVLISKEVKGLLEFIDTIVDCVSGDYYIEDRKFLKEKLIKKLVDELTKEEGISIKENISMSDKESQMFGNNVMTFGKFKGFRIDDIPLDYLEWLADSNSFVIQLSRYLQSRRIKEENNANN